MYKLYFTIYVTGEIYGDKYFSSKITVLNYMSELLKNIITVFPWYNTYKNFWDKEIYKYKNNRTHKLILRGPDFYITIES